MKKHLIIWAAVLAVMFALCAQAALAVSELSHFSARIGASPAVYSGPGKEYYRANNGKAQYGKGGVARIYGLAPNGWMMIGYELGSGDYRIGYVAPANADLLYGIKDWDSAIPQLSLDSVSAVITADCELIDDPVIHTKPIAYLGRGIAVTYLATLGKWAYIEVDCSIGLARAFVRQEYLSTSGDVVINPGNNPGHVGGVPASGSWRSLYRQYLQVNGSNEWFMLRLMDLDFDGTPELLITTESAHVGTRIHVLSIQNGGVAVSEFTVMEFDGNSEWSYPSDLMLFYNAGTSQYEWLFFDGYVMGEHESNMVNRLMYAGGQVWTAELFRHTMEGNEQTYDVVHTYYADGQEISKDAYDGRFELFRTQIQPQNFKVTVYDLMTGDRHVLSAFEQIAQEYE